MTPRRDGIPAAERRRLERLRELAAAHRRTERALGRAVRAALVRGISVRRIAAAIGLPTMTVWARFVKTTGADQPGLSREDVKLPPRTPTGQPSGATRLHGPANGPGKRKASGK